MGCRAAFFCHLLSGGSIVVPKRPAATKCRQTKVGIATPEQMVLCCESEVHSFSVYSLASVTHGHGTQALYRRCAKQKDRAKIFHCFKLENKASSRSAPPTTAVASLYTLDPQEFFGHPRRCRCSAIRGRRV